MSALVPWLAGREPAPPEPLAEALRKLLAASAADDGERDGARTRTAEALAAQARDCLERAAARPGRDRESAYRLLEADALFTYACEAALEEADPEPTLRHIHSVASRSR